MLEIQFFRHSTTTTGANEEVQEVMNMKMSFAGHFFHYVLNEILSLHNCHNYMCHHAAGICESLLRKRNDDGRQQSALALSKY